MHGIFFLALEDFLDSHCEKETWLRVLREANLAEQIFEADRFYPDEDWICLFSATAKVLGISLAQTLEKLGIHMAPGVLTIGQSMGLLQKEWRTLDILEFLPKTILPAFESSSDSEIKTEVKFPTIRTYRSKHSEVSVAYVSNRKLCHLLKGIILGMGKIFNEPIRFQERVCLLENAPICRLSVYLDDPALRHYVDIPKEFQIVQSRIQEIRLFSQFQGIPVIHPSLVLNFTAETVLVQTQPNILVAMRSEGVVYLTLPHRTVGLKAHVSEIHLPEGTALLHSITITDGPVGHRFFPRTLPPEPMGIELRLNRQTFQGWVANLSESGLCMVLKHHPILEETMLYTSIKVRFSLPTFLQRSGKFREIVYKALVLEGNILTIDHLGGRHRIRIVFRPPTIDKTLTIRSYYRWREQNALSALKSLLEL